MPKASVQSTCITQIHRGVSKTQDDLLAVEEPMEIRLGFGGENERAQKSIAVTMRTPGHDFELAAGFLFTEGIIHHKKDIDRIDYCKDKGTENRHNVVRVELKSDLKPDLEKLQRNFFANSSCGICGKASIEAIYQHNIPALKKGFQVSDKLILALPQRIEKSQMVFAHTGGLHAAALFSRRGELLLIREDIGRHNALDKLIGASILSEKLPLSEAVLFLSGRIGFELVQKALIAGIPLLAALGAPSSLAVDLAKASGMQLIGFIRNEKFNIYN